MKKNKVYTISDLYAREWRTAIINVANLLNEEKDYLKQQQYIREPYTFKDWRIISEIARDRNFIFDASGNIVS